MKKFLILFLLSFFCPSLDVGAGFDRYLSLEQEGPTLFLYLRHVPQEILSSLEEGEKDYSLRLHAIALEGGGEEETALSIIDLLEPEGPPLLETSTSQIFRATSERLRDAALPQFLQRDTEADIRDGLVICPAEDLQHWILTYPEMQGFALTFSLKNDPETPLFRCLFERDPQHSWTCLESNTQGDLWSILTWQMSDGSFLSLTD